MPEKKNLPHSHFWASPGVRPSTVLMAVQSAARLPAAMGPGGGAGAAVQGGGQVCVCGGVGVAGASVRRGQASPWRGGQGPTA